MPTPTAYDEKAIITLTDRDAMQTINLLHELVVEVEFYDTEAITRAVEIAECLAAQLENHPYFIASDQIDAMRDMRDHLSEESADEEEDETT